LTLCAALPETASTGSVEVIWRGTRSDNFILVVTISPEKPLFELVRVVIDGLVARFLS
jgi:hypothetical protein